MQFDRTLVTIMETPASNQAIAGILSQYHIGNGGKQRHPVEYHAKILSAALRNCAIHDKELFEIVDSLRKCWDWLVGVEVNVYTDHQGGNTSILSRSWTPVKGLGTSTCLNSATTSTTDMEIRLVNQIVYLDVQGKRNQEWMQSFQRTDSFST